MMTYMRVLVLGLFALAMGNAQAALFDRGGGLIYDDMLNVTWLQDVNYAKTSGYDADGKMTWEQALSWVSQLNYGGFDDWRLPTKQPLNGLSWNMTNSPANFTGMNDRGYNITSQLDEMSYMYYVNLGLIGEMSPTGQTQPNYGPLGKGKYGVGLQTDLAYFTNIFVFRGT